MFEELLRRHRELKHKIHTTRIPLGRRGRIIMTCVYFCTPLLVGKVLFDWTNKARNEKWGLDDQGRLSAQQEKRVYETDSSKLTDPKSRLEQVFAAAGASTPPTS